MDLELNILSFIRLSLNPFINVIPIIFRNNEFETLSPEVLYSNSTPWDLVGTRIIQGNGHVYGANNI